MQTLVPRRAAPRNRPPPSHTVAGPFTGNLDSLIVAAVLTYISFQLLSIPFALRASKERFIGVVDGLASMVPLGISLIVIVGKPELLGTLQRWEAAFLLLFIAAVDLFGGYTFNLALSRRMMDVGPMTA